MSRAWTPWRRSGPRHRLPPVHEPVSLWTPALGTLDGYAEHAEESFVTLTLAVPLAPPEALARPRRGQLSFVTGRRLYRLDGRASAAAGAPFVHFHVEGGKVVDRREHPRVAAGLRVSIGAPGARTPTLIGVTVDVSAGGLRIADPHDLLPVAGSVRVRLWLPDHDRPLKLDGQVVRRADDGEKAVRFDRLAARADRRLVRFTFDQQRRERAGERGA